MLFHQNKFLEWQKFRDMRKNKMPRGKAWKRLAVIEWRRHRNSVEKFNVQYALIVDDPSCEN